jgi:hypothetical protein
MSRRWQASQPGRQRAGENRAQRPGAAAVPGHRGLYTGRYDGAPGWGSPKNPPKNGSVNVPIINHWKNPL